MDQVSGRSGPRPYNKGRSSSQAPILESMPPGHSHLNVGLVEKNYTLEGIARFACGRRNQGRQNIETRKVDLHAQTNSKNK